MPAQKALYNINNKLLTISAGAGTFLTAELDIMAAPLTMNRKVASSRPAFQASSGRLAPPARHSVVVRSTGWADSAATNAEKAMFGENFGARDPFAAEIESNFGDKVLGHYNTDHIIKIPTKMKSHLGLTAQSCVPVEQLTLLEEKELNLLKQQTPGWKVITNKSGHQAIRHEWRLKSPEAATQLQTMIQELADVKVHAPEIVISGEVITAELNTPSVQGISINDLIVAAKINELNVKDLMPPPRKRFWA